jgi:hypothetical protein
MLPVNMESNWVYSFTQTNCPVRYVFNLHTVQTTAIRCHTCEVHVLNLNNFFSRFKEDCLFVQQAEICTSVGASIRAFYLAPLFELLLGHPMFCISNAGVKKGISVVLHVQLVCDWV